MNFPKPAVGMLPNDRLAYSAIAQRKPLKLPKGARMAVWTITNVEEWDPTQAMPRTVLTPPAGGSPMPDIPNWCWHEYGNRVGFWRLLQVYDDFKVPGVMNINGVAALAYPDIVKACVDRNWEFLGHGHTQRNMQKVANERDDIRNCAAAIEKASGKRPRGWLGPGLTETWETPDILAEEGYDYVADWVLDDQPVWLKTRSQADPEHSLHAGMQRRRHDADPAPQGERVLRAGDRPVRADLQGRQGLGPGDGDLGAPLHHGRGAPRQIFPQDLREDQEEEGRLVLHRRADRGLVQEGRAGGAVIHTPSCPALCRASTPSMH